MKVYILTAAVTVSTFTRVKANSEEEALAKASQRDVELYFNGSGTSPEDSWCIESGDGVPCDIDVQEGSEDDWEGSGYEEEDEEADEEEGVE
jgi:magnesium-transporting ATPase (P-type)